MTDPGHREIEPRSDSAGKKPAGGGSLNRNTVLRGVARVETLIQIALVLPIAVVLGWAIGDWLDHKFHQDWISIIGLLIGVAAGFTQAIRLANQANRSGD
jgi:F0F1-type ATP synthase assembly protein I